MGKYLIPPMVKTMADRQANDNLDPLNIESYRILEDAAGQLLALGMQPAAPWRFLAWAAAERLAPEDLPRLIEIISQRRDQP